MKVKTRESKIIDDCAFRSIIKDSMTFHIFEEVNMKHPVWYIAKRTSVDGIHFSERSKSLIKCTDFDINGQADPSVLKEDVWRMYFDALNEDSIWDRIGLAFSNDGDNWIKYGAVLRRGGGGTWDDKSIHHPVIIKHKGIYYLFYSGSSHRDKHIVRSIGLATSNDGVHFIKHPKNPLLMPGSGWDKNYIRPSRPFLLGNTWYMFYWGYNGWDRNIGLASSKDLIKWIKYGIIIENATASDVIITEDTIKVWFTRFVSPNKNSLHYKSFTKQEIITKGKEIV